MLADGRSPHAAYRKLHRHLFPLSGCLHHHVRFLLGWRPPLVEWDFLLNISEARSWDSVMRAFADYESDANRDTTWLMRVLGGVPNRDRVARFYFALTGSAGEPR